MRHDDLAPPARVDESTEENEEATARGQRVTVPQSDTSVLIRWQARLLPLMSLLLVGLTVFFVATSVYQLYSLKASIMSQPQLLVEKEMEVFRPAPDDFPANSFEKGKWATLVRLEASAIERRYHQATAVTLARVWTIYLGFLTGMILSLVGAAFILGKLRESTSQLDLSGGVWKAAVQSSSPGIVLAVLGTTLMIVTILARVEVKVEDRPLYVGDVVFVPAQSGEGAKDPQETPDGKDKITVTHPDSDAGAQRIIDDAAKKLERGESNPASPKPSPESRQH
jgi:hypothetical protein